MKPDVSLYGSAAKVDLWMRLYESIGKSKVTFEVVFAGPNEPTFTLPDNFKFIKTNVKPTQCLEIAVRQTTADLIMQVADDCVFTEEHPLERLYETYVSYNNPKLILSCRYVCNGKDLSATCHRFFTKDQTSPLVPLSGLMSRQLYMDIGGIDRNFIAIMFDLDITMRVYALGGTVVLSDVHLNESHNRRGLCHQFWGYDRPLLESLWSVDGKCHFNRTKPVELFSDERILEESQGPKGRWP